MVIHHANVLRRGRGGGGVLFVYLFLYAKSTAAGISALYGKFERVWLISFKFGGYI